MNTSHFVLGNSMVKPWPDSTQVAIFGLGCFWGAERKFWQLEGVYTTAVGYSGGEKLNPTYREVCNVDTMHVEVVLVAFDPSKISYEKLLQVFWESHDPTQKLCFLVNSQTQRMPVLQPDMANFLVLTLY